MALAGAPSICVRFEIERAFTQIFHETLYRYQSHKSGVALALANQLSNNAALSPSPPGLVLYP
jgi:hypothetical protein